MSERVADLLSRMTREEKLAQLVGYWGLLDPETGELGPYRTPLVSVADGQAGFVENGWIGKTLALGDSVRLRVTDPCPRCVMTTLAQEELPADAGILRTAARHNPVVGGEGRGPDGAYPASVGVYASVVAGGTVRRGDTVRLIS